MIIFDEKNHQYSDEFFNTYTSVSTVLNFMLGNKFDKVPKKMLRQASGKGTFIHDEINDYLKHGIEGIADECKAFVEWHRTNLIQVIASEVIVASPKFRVAGRFDILTKDEMIDVKTGSTVDIERTTWQLSLYNYLENNGSDVSNVRQNFNGMILHIRGTVLKPIPVQLYSYEQCEAFLSDFKEGKPWQNLETTQELNSLPEPSHLAYTIAKIKRLEDSIKALKQAILTEMEDKDIKKYTDKHLNITYIAPSFKQVFDTKKLKQELPEIYNKYISSTDVKASIRITLEENNNDKIK